ncbi:Abi family protein [Photobacterium gaetbulicola]|uniref:Abi family protein n=1 Tax=Photobacterium gaetbulicola TaxID=1295392 RepID=UPI0009DFA61D|nr:Abi family protein [Photobacterium gaetbulicola]
MGLALLPTNYNILFDALSRPRIGAYRTYFGNSLSDEQLHGCYQWNESVSLSFFKVITLIEIVMRNRMHYALSNHYHQTQKQVVDNSGLPFRRWTFSQQRTSGSATSCNWYEAGVLNNFSLSKIHELTHHKRNKQPLVGRRKPSPDDVVSSLTFGFWSSLIDKAPAIAWAQVLGNIFPKHRATSAGQWINAAHKQRLIFRLQLIRDFRNRIAHHEPIWKLPPLLDERPPRQGQQRAVLQPATTNPSESIRRLRMIYSKHTELLRWMSQEIYDDLQASTLHKHILWLCSEEGLNAHINRSELMPISMKPARFKRELQSILRSKRVTYLHRDGRNLIATQPIP